MDPYESPRELNWRPDESPNSKHAAQEAVKTPALMLMIVAGISIALLTLTIPFEIFLLASGRAEQFDRGGADPVATIVVRLAWSVLLLVSSCYTFWGALQMKKLTSFFHARAAATVAAIPCVGPCCLLGIPFGIWALTVISRREVRSAFDDV